MSITPMSKHFLAEIREYKSQYENNFEPIFPGKIFAWDPALEGGDYSAFTITKKPMSRELKRDIRRPNLGIIQFSPDLILTLLQIPDIILVHGHEGINYDFNSETFKVKVRHESFPLVREGDVIPVISPGILLIDKCKECKNPKINYDFSFALDNQYDDAYIRATKMKAQHEAKY